MPHVLVHVSVKDQSAWKKGFEQAGALRKKFGSLGVNAFAKVDDPNEIYIVGEYKDLEQARQMFQSQEFRDATQAAGLTKPPEVTFLFDVLKLAA
jgi:quinol monooxygenase YgiN